MSTTPVFRYPLSIVAASAGLAVTLIVLFVICAAAQFIAPDVQAAHAWIGLFTLAPLNSVRAWVEGLLASLVLGWIAGATFALVYNAVTGREQ